MSAVPDGAPANEQRVLVLAPVGRDASVVLMVLETAGYSVTATETLGEFVGHMEHGASLGILTEEALAGETLEGLDRWIRQQPP